MDGCLNTAVVPSFGNGNGSSDNINCVFEMKDSVETWEYDSIRRKKLGIQETHVYFPAVAPPLADAIPGAVKLARAPPAAIVATSFKRDRRLHWFSPEGATL